MRHRDTPPRGAETQQRHRVPAGAQRAGLACVPGPDAPHGRSANAGASQSATRSPATARRTCERLSQRNKNLLAHESRHSPRHSGFTCGGAEPGCQRAYGRARPTPRLAGPQGQALRKRAYVKGQVAGPPFCDTIQLTRDVGMAGVGGGLHGDGSVLHLNRGAGHRTRRCRGMTQSYVHITMSASWSGYGPVVPEEISQGGNWGEGTSGCCLYNFL